MSKIALTLALVLCIAACHPKATAPVPGTINSFDAYSARVIGDSQEAIMSAKAWQACSDAAVKVPFVTLDGETRPCDPAAPAFPTAGRPILFQAENSYNVALAAAQAYHAGATSDTAGLTQAITQLGVAISNLLTSLGKAH
jgi:hypothetical protein